MVMSGQSRAIFWAQWRSLRNMFPRTRKGSAIVIAIGSLVWYSVWTIAAVAAALVLRDTRDLARAFQFLSPGLLVAILYWQVIPVLMVSTGASLQVKKLLVYPIPHGELFGLEVLLRLSTGLEMIILLCGMTAGIAMSPVLPLWPALVFLPFLAFNLYVAAGVRELLVRFFSQKRSRELAVFFIAMLAALPQVLLTSRVAIQFGDWLKHIPNIPWPWSATAHIITGQYQLRHWLALFAWLAASYAFGRILFERGLRFDEDAARSSSKITTSDSNWRERLFRLPGLVLRDPIGALVEKEFRSLFRSSAFRLLFLMGFTFGLLIWFPMKYRGTLTPDHFFVIVCAYAVLLLSDALIWNFFGFDRSAVQFYLLAPVRVLDVLIAKDIAAAAVVFLELFAITIVCVVAGFMRSPHIAIDAYLVCGVSMVYMLGIGNWSSLKYPKPVDPNQSWKRGNPGRFRFLLLLIYPVLAAPFAFAYFARNTWESQWVFYGVLIGMAAGGAAVYGLFLESALKIADRKREEVLRDLSQTESPITSILEA